MSDNKKHIVETADGQLVEVSAKPLGPVRRRTIHPALDALQDTDDLVKEQVGGFVNFIREHAVVGLAVGFIVGAQAQTVVKELVNSFINPILILLFGTQLGSRKFAVSLFGRQADFTWGAMVYALINLFFVLLSIYILIKVLKLDKLDKPTT